MTIAPAEAPTLFPRFICRIGALPTERVAALSDDRCRRLIADLGACRSEITATRGELSDLLFAAVGTTTARDDRRLLINTRRDVFNDRPVRDIDAPRLLEILPSRGSAVLARYCDRIARYAATLAAIEEMVPLALAESRRVLRDVVGTPEVQTGLLISSQLTFDRQSEYLAAPHGALDSRALRMERTLLRYATRTAMKATPFSTFCTVLPGVVVPATDSTPGARSLAVAGNVRRQCSSVRINKYLATVVLGVLASHSVGHGAFALEINPTLAFDGGDIVLLASTGNREVFRRLPASPGIRAILDAVRTYGPMTRARLVSAVAPDGDTASAEQFLDRLTELGVLRRMTPFADGDADWDRSLCQSLSAADDPVASQVSHLLVRIRAIADAYPDSPVETRRALLGDAAHVLTDALPALGVTSVPTNLPLFEDATAAAVPAISATPGVRHMFATLGQFLAEVRRLSEPRRLNAGVRRFFDTFYGPGTTTVPLLRLFEDFHRERVKPSLETRDNQEDDRTQNPFGVPLVDAMIDGERRLNDLILRSCTAALHAEEVAVSMDDVRRALADVPPLPREAASAAVFGEIVDLPGRVDAPRFVMTNGACCSGFGKMFSRFLYQFPNGFLDDLRARNRELSHAVLAEVADDGGSNANLHPPLLDAEIDYPRQWGHARPRSLHVRDLVVERHPHHDDRLVLRDESTGRQVLPVDLGFITPRARGPLFRLLTRFAPPVDWRLRLAIPAPDPASQISYRPRIVVDDRIVLARRSWNVPADAVPHPLPGDGAAMYFARLNLWRIEAGIPEQAYVRFAAVTSDAPSGRRHVRSDVNARKPQFIDFTSPLLVGLFGRLVAASTRGLRIDERYPPHAVSLGTDGETHVTEQAFQFDWHD